MGIGRLTRSLVTRLDRKYGLLTSSGSAALILSLRSANIPFGSEIIMPTICCPAVLSAIQLAGYIPILADISLKNFCMNKNEVEDVMTSNTKAIIAVHGYGHYCDIDELEVFAKEKGLVLIEDACLSMGSTFKGKPTGSFGDISIVSFGYDKIISEHYGGALVTDELSFFEEAENILLSNSIFKFNDHLDHCDNIEKKLRDLDDAISERKNNSRLCHDLLIDDHIKKLPFSEDIVYWRYPALIIKNRNKLVKDALEHEIIITTHYKPLHHFYTGLNFKNAQYLSENIINIFIRPETPKQQILDTINFINMFLE